MGVAGEDTKEKFFKSLNLLKDTDTLVSDIVNTQVTPQVTPQVEQILSIIKGEMLRSEIQAELKLSDRKSFRQTYLQPAIEQNIIQMTIPDKPNSRLQKYRLTQKGIELKKLLQTVICHP